MNKVDWLAFLAVIFNLGAMYLANQRINLFVPLWFFSMALFCFALGAKQEEKKGAKKWIK